MIGKRSDQGEKRMNKYREKKRAATIVRCFYFEWDEGGNRKGENEKI